MQGRAGHKLIVGIENTSLSKKVGLATRATRPGARRRKSIARLRLPVRLWPATLLSSTSCSRAGDPPFAWKPCKLPGKLKLKRAPSFGDRQRRRARKREPCRDQRLRLDHGIGDRGPRRRRSRCNMRSAIGLRKSGPASSPASPVRIRTGNRHCRHCNRYPSRRVLAIRIAS